MEYHREISIGHTFDSLIPSWGQSRSLTRSPQRMMIDSYMSLLTYIYVGVGRLHPEMPLPMMFQMLQRLTLWNYDLCSPLLLPHLRLISASLCRRSRYRIYPLVSRSLPAKLALPDFCSLLCWFSQKKLLLVLHSSRVEMLLTSAKYDFVAQRSGSKSVRTKKQTGVAQLLPTQPRYLTNCLDILSSSFTYLTIRYMWLTPPFLSEHNHLCLCDRVKKLTPSDRWLGLAAHFFLCLFLLSPYYIKVRGFHHE